MRHLVLAYGHGFGSHRGGLGEVGRVIAHAAIWTVVASFIRTLPAGVQVLALLLAGGGLLMGRRRRVNR